MRFPRIVFMQLIYALPLVFFMAFGLFHTSELGFLIAATEQASFFAARSQFVDGESGKSVDLISQTSLDAISASANRESELKVSPMKLELQEGEERTIAKVSLIYPDLFPQREYFYANSPLFEASTLVPKKGNP